MFKILDFAPFLSIYSQSGRNSKKYSQYDILDLVSFLYSESDIYTNLPNLQKSSKKSTYLGRRFLIHQICDDHWCANWLQNCLKVNVFDEWPKGIIVQLKTCNFCTGTYYVYFIVQVGYLFETSFRDFAKLFLQEPRSWWISLDIILKF